jgi:hypothetical protein
MSFMLLVRYSGAVDGKNMVVLGVLRIAATVLMVLFVARALVADVKAYANNGELGSSRSDEGIEMGALSLSVVEGTQAEPGGGEETGKSAAIGHTTTGGPSPRGTTDEDTTAAVQCATEDVSILGFLCVGSGQSQAQLEDTTVSRE